MAIAASRSRASAGSDEAIACYEPALALRPQAADTHNNLGVALKQQGKLGEAIAHFEAALALASSYAEAHLNLAAALLASADQLEAQRHVLAALALKETLETRALFVRCLADMQLAAAPRELRELIVRALVEPWGRPRLLSSVAASLIKREPAIADCLRRSREAWPVRLHAAELFAEDGLAALAGDALLSALLASAPICDAELETLLTAPPAVLPRNRDRPGGERRRPRRHARICRGARPAMLDQRICLRRDR